MNRLWLVNVLIDLGQYESAQKELIGLFDDAKEKGKWWSPEAKERAEQYWRSVTSDELPD